MIDIRYYHLYNYNINKVGKVQIYSTNDKDYDADII